MFTPDFYIDQFQSTKRMLTNQVFKDPTLNKVCNEFIDSQTAFAKMLTKNALTIATYSVDSVSKYFFPQDTVKSTVVEAEKTVKPKTAKKKAAVVETTEENTDINTQGE